MNFLGHLYFSGDDHALMYANLFGDFVKGSDLSSYPQSIRNGIVLHRNIDQYIDHHPAVAELMPKLYPKLPKVSAIAVDLFFDHLLASRWSEFHPMDYRDFLNAFYAHPIAHRRDYSIEFLDFINRLRENDWMFYYRTSWGLDKMCSGVGSRLSFPNTLHIAPKVFDELKDTIEEIFERYMHDAIPHFKQIIQSLENEPRA
ncbi:MAG: ACP phosphodiesterase [Bacteroidota bacterium]|jgi:acyl carrier protein phosphodiesterase